MLKKFLVIVNTFTLAIMLWVNALAGTGKIAGKNVGEISGQYETLITPESYAFGIWGLIYSLLVIFMIFQWIVLIKEKDLDIIRKTGIFFTLANLANIAWLFLWLNEYLGFSVLAMLVLLTTLIILVYRLDLEIWDAPVRIIIFVWWPVVIYLGWIIIAAVTNIAAFLTSTGWDGSPLSPQLWTILMILISTGIYTFLTFTRNLRESALAGIWAFVAIGVKQSAVHPDITFTALAAAAVLTIEVVYHGFRNRDTSPFRKIKRGEF